MKTNNWQPMETAPKDGTDILIFTVPDSDDDSTPIRIVRWKEADRWNRDRWELSHYDAFYVLPNEALGWQPLPEIP